MRDLPCVGVNCVDNELSNGGRNLIVGITSSMSDSVDVDHVMADRLQDTRVREKGR